MKSYLMKWLPQLGLVLVIMGLAAFLASRGDHVLEAATVAQVFRYYSPMALLGLGMTLIILTGGIDLSVGFVMMLLEFVMAAQVRDNPAVSMVRVFGMGLLVSMMLAGGLGALVAYLRIPSFIVSLAMMVGAYGASIFISKNQAIGGLPDGLVWLGKSEFHLGSTDYPVSMIVVLVAYLATALMLTRTSFGRHIYALGSNREAARLSGINVPKTETIVYMLSGLFVLIGAIIQLGINRNADPKVALSDSLELNAIAIVVIGGASLTGGRGGVGGTFLGWVLLSLIFVGPDLTNVKELHEPSYKKVILGGIILLGAVLDALRRRFGKAG